MWILSSLVIDSLAIAGQTLVAVELGRGDVKAAREVTDRLLQMGAGLGAALAATVMLTGEYWPHLFTQVRFA